MSRRLSILAFTSFAVAPSVALAEYADTTASLGAGDLSLAAEFQADVRDNTPLLVNLHESVGLASGVDLSA